MKRHFYLHVGETNTGKTYASIERLMEAESGVYLAPLRLLALEIQDKLNSENIACSLLTGEEENILSYAYHVSSTIEKLQLETPYDICVIDEAQMIADKQRGWAWTRAILGVLSPEVHICMAPEALDIVIKLIKDCKDTYEIIEHKRDTKLIFEDKPFDLNKDVKKGDALVVFGKKEGRLPLPPIPEEYNEGAYLKLNPDVNEAVKNGIFVSGIDHYLQYGFNESRKVSY